MSKSDAISIFYVLKLFAPFNAHETIERLEEADVEFSRKGAVERDVILTLRASDIQLFQQGGRVALLSHYPEPGPFEQVVEVLEIEDVDSGLITRLEVRSLKPLRGLRKVPWATKLRPKGASGNSCYSASKPAPYYVAGALTKYLLFERANGTVWIPKPRLDRKEVARICNLASKKKYSVAESEELALKALRLVKNCWDERPSAVTSSQHHLWWISHKIREAYRVGNIPELIQKIKQKTADPIDLDSLL